MRVSTLIVYALAVTHVGLVAPASAAMVHENFRDDGFSNVYVADNMVNPVKEKVRGGDEPAFNRKVMANWTFQSKSVQNFTATGGKVTFRIEGRTATLGWGDALRKKGDPEVSRLWDGKNFVRIRARQSGKATWTVTLWSRGGKERAYRFAKNDDSKGLGAEKWRDLEFLCWMPGADGMEVHIQAENAGDTVDIESLKFVKREYTGRFRRTFTVPPDASVWRAVCAVSGGNQVYVNGKAVDLGFLDRIPPQQMRSFDIAPYLRKGRNVIAMENAFPTFFSAAQMAYLHGTVVFASGEVIALHSGRDWKVHAGEEQDWTQVDFDDNGWTAPDVTHIPGNVFQYSARRSELYPLPAYCGRVVFRNPRAGTLHFDGKDPVTVEAHLPRGLSTHEPKLAWTVHCVHPLALENRKIADGTITDFRVEGDSIVFPIALGSLDYAVYTVQARVIGTSGKTLEERYREAFIVYGKLEQKEVSGREYTEGLDYVLEDTIEFINPNDPHKSIEVLGYWKQEVVDEPKVVTRNGLTYRETQSDEWCSGFAYQFTFQHPGDWYMLEMDYPDDKFRLLGFSISTPDARNHIYPKRRTTKGYFAQSGPAIYTGYNKPVSNSIRTLRWLQRGDPGTSCVEVFNVVKGQRAAAVRLRIYRVKGSLPAVKSIDRGERRFGRYLERPRHLGVNFGILDPSPYEFHYNNHKDKLDFLDFHYMRTAWYWDVILHTTEYMNFTGENFINLGAYQYRHINQSYVKPSGLEGKSPRISSDIREMALPLFDANGIQGISWIEYVDDRGLYAKHFTTDQLVREGQDTLKFVTRAGRQSHNMFNYNHPLVIRDFEDICGEITSKFSRFKAWKGVYMMPCTHWNGFGPALSIRGNDPYAVDYSDVTIKLFEKETGIKVPGEGPERFMARYKFLTSDEMLPRWADWRCRKQLAIFQKALAVIRRIGGDDTMLVVNPTPQMSVFQRWFTSGRSYYDIRKEYGFDLNLFQQADGLWFGRPITSLFRSGGDPIRWWHRVAPDVINAFDAEEKRLVTIRDGWIEPDFRLPEGTDWLYEHNDIRVLPQQSGDYTKQMFNEAMILSDPKVYLFGFADVGQYTGQEQKLREMIRSFKALPGKKMKPLLNTGLDTDLALRGVAAADGYYFTVMNPGFWPVEGTVTLAGATGVLDASTGEPVEGLRKDDEKTVLPVRLEPYGMRSYRVPDALAAVTGYQTGRPGETVERHIAAEREAAFDAMKSPDFNRLLDAEETALLVTQCKASESELAAERLNGAWRALHKGSFQYIVEKRSAMAPYSARLPRTGGTEESGPPQIAAAQAGAAPVVDGKLDEAVWARAAPISVSRAVSTKLVQLDRVPVVETAVRAAYDAENLYIGAALADRDPTALKATATLPPEVLWRHDDCFDFFLQVPGSRDVYQFAVNPAGTRYSPVAVNGQVMKSKQIRKGLQTTVPLVAWDAAVARGEKTWTIEIRVPFSAIDAQGPPEEGKAWKINFRRRYRAFFEVPEHTWALVDGYHNAEDYGDLRFN